MAAAVDLPRQMTQIEGRAIVHRKEDWHDRMWATLDDLANTQFEYGKIDCCIFAAKVVDAMCDTEYEKELAKHYRDEDTAKAYIEVSGGLEQAVSSHIGQSKQGKPQRGNVVMFAGELGQTLGICVGSTIASVNSDGVVFVPRSATICYWTI
jgi:hypothetical protein